MRTTRDFAASAEATERFAERYIEWMAAATPSTGDSVRERAKAATLVVSVLTILVGADPLDIRSSSNLFQWLDYVLIAGWIIAILLFLYAQTAANTGERKLQYALGVAAFAGACTVLLLGAKAAGLSNDYDTMLLQVENEELAAITSVCQKSGKQLHLFGQVRTGALGDDFILLKPDSGANSTCK